jgi:membrane-bound inhibitor of C-type lysozyme
MLARTHAPTSNRMISFRRFLLIAAALLFAACQSSGPTKEELEAAKNTIDCDYGGERIVIRFADGEARLLMADGTRVILYQIAAASGLRYTNGLMELRGTGLDLQLARDRITMKMICKPYEIPPKKE